MDIILEIMRHDAPVADSPGKWREGECVLVREATPELLLAIGGVCNVPRKCYLVVTDLPPLITDIQQVRNILDSMDWTDDAKPDEDFNSRRRWQGVFSDFPPPQRNALLNPPYYLERTWAQVRGRFMRNKRTLNFWADIDF